MLKKLGVVATAVALVALTVSVISPALSESRYKAKTLHFAEKFSDDEENNVDVGDEGFSAGDYFVFDDVLYNASRTQRAGTGRGSCTVLSVDFENETAVLKCDVTFELDNGDIETVGVFDESASDTQHFSVTGGTGAYRTAHGVLRITEENQGLDFVFKLLL